LARPPRNREHFHIQGSGESERYTSPRLVINGLPPARARAAHAEHLERALNGAIAEARGLLDTREPAIAEGERGFYLDFEIPVEHQIALDGLENRQKKIELVAVKPPAEGGDTVRATVFVPETEADYYIGKVEQYRDVDTKTGRPRNQNLVARIDDVRLAVVRSLFTDDDVLLPPEGRQVWWEIWLRDGRLQSFQNVARRQNVRLREYRLSFPERDVVLALADLAMMQRLLINSDGVAELRLSKDTPDFFLAMRPVEQAEWAGNLVERAAQPSALAPVVCILDSGATQAHPLIAPGLDPADQYSYDDAWGVEDSAYWNGHGTMMAGTVLYGDVEAALSTGLPIQLSHGLETLKILPPNAQNEPELYGAVTEIGIGKAEKSFPGRNRAFCMAVTSGVGVARGRPSSWSAAVDKLCYGGGDRRRLIVLAAGNIRDPIIHSEYPDNNDLAEAENPCQSWNTLVAGAYTDKINILDPTFNGWTSLAPAGELSPASRTSTLWDRQWPVRPDVVFEGGNFAHDGVNPAEAINDLQLITTHHQPQNRLFDSFGDTSAASALAANFSAQIMAGHPNLWPETIRGLVVHSAEWTPAMRDRMDAAGSQAQKAALLRRYGWGVPDINRAMRSAANDATLMIEDALLPLRRERSQIKTRDMQLHRLPWPRDELLALGEEDVELRVTLSYFIEPNPGMRGWTKRHRYASHSLRFAVKRSLETLQQFRQRINRAAEAEEDGDIGFAAGSDNWVLGRIRDRGSIHSDIWRGSAAALAERDAIGIFPVGGWWKEKPNLQRWDRSVRYSLTVSVRAPDAEIDLHAAIENKLAVEIPSA
jgi:hypothetical protein